MVFTSNNMSTAAVTSYVIIFSVSPTPQGCNIRMLTNTRLYKGEQPDGPNNGMMINMTSTLYLESLLWSFSILAWSHIFSTMGFNFHSSDVCTL